jgi:hypothetical protein
MLEGRPEESMKPFTASTVAILALSVAGFFAVRDFALGLIGLVGLGALWLDFSRARQDPNQRLEFPAFSLASLAVIALFAQGFFAVGGIALGFTGLIGLLSVCIDVSFLRSGRLAPVRAFSVPVLALVGMVLGGVFDVSDLAIGFSGLIGLIALTFDISRKPSSVRLEPEAQVPLSDLELIGQDRQPVR